MKLFTIIIIFFLNFNATATADLQIFLKNKWKLSKTQMRYFNNAKILAKSEVDDFDDKQSFGMKALVKHPRKCSKALRKLSLLEQYQDWINFIKMSKYDPKNRLFTIKADHPLLPFPMIVHIIVDRPTKEGRYPFVFPTGMFRGLSGYFEIREFNKKCVFYAHSNWIGKKTKIPNIVIEIFSETLSKIGGEILIRKST